MYDPDRKVYYELAETLGKGNLGKGPNKVKKAINLNTKEEVAIKILRGSVCSVEIEILKILDRYKGDFLVPSLKHGLVNQYIVQTLISGQTLAAQSDSLDSKQATEVIEQCVARLMEYHKLGIIWGDVKAENIMYDSNTGQITFIDFGLSYLVTKDPQGQQIYLFDNGDATVSESLGQEKLEEFKKLDIKLMYDMLSDIFKKQVQSDSKIREVLDQTKLGTVSNNKMRLV